MLKSHAVSKDSQSSDRKQNFYKQEYRVADSCAGGVIGKNGIKITEIRLDIKMLKNLAQKNATLT